MLSEVREFIDRTRTHWTGCAGDAQSTPNYLRVEMPDMCAFRDFPQIKA